MDRQFPANISADDITSDQIRAEQVRITFASIPASLLAIFVNSSLLVVLLWNEIDQSYLMIWFLLTNMLSVIRWQLYRQYKRAAQSLPGERNWYRLLVITIALSGITWAAVGIWLFSHNSVMHQVFLAFVVGGMCAGGVATLSAILSAGRSFVVFAAAPIIVQFMLSSQEAANYMMIMSVLFLGMLLASLNRLNKTITASIVESLVSRRQREIVEREIRYQAEYDESTGLPNRRLLQEILVGEIARASITDSVGAILFIDVDRFKTINYGLGNLIGEDLIVQVGKRLTSRMAADDTVARIGNNEFVVILSDIAANLTLANLPVQDIANEYHKLLDAPYVVHGHQFHITTSIGVTLFPVENIDAGELIQYAEIAMYEARKGGKTDVLLFTGEMYDSVNQRRVVEKELQLALDKSEFELYFQPQYDRNNEIIASEALLRWNHPVRGVLLPDQFLEIAEQTGLIVAIGEWVLRSACEFQAMLEPVSSQKISVNISPRQFGNVRFNEILNDIIEQTKANPERLKIELTEAMLLEPGEHASDKLEQLKSLGIEISIDGFGTGYSSFSQLNRLPVDEIKLGKGIVSGIDSSTENAAIAESITLIAQHLGVRLAAQGVETEAELKYFKD
ncbi:MAG: EAL domain-containing protein, partial [Gammaproteobacteria bacterium]|nr:EAL domain-containing protein [Gammaproteobacteria bacterium]